MESTGVTPGHTVIHVILDHKVHFTLSRGRPKSIQYNTNTVLHVLNNESASGHPDILGYIQDGLESASESAFPDSTESAQGPLRVCRFSRTPPA